jgi:hypothetical protein
MQSNPGNRPNSSRGAIQGGTLLIEGRSGPFGEMIYPVLRPCWAAASFCASSHFSASM